MAAPKIVTGPQPRDPDMFGPLGQPHTLVAHHGEGERDRDDAHGLKILEGYNRFHDQTRGWGGIGYQFAILRSGTIVKLRPVHLKGAHSFPNSGCIGVVFPGGYEATSPTWAQMDSLRWLWTSGVLIPSGLKLVTHRERNQTSCPGAQLQAAVNTLRTRRPSKPAPPRTVRPRAWHQDPAKVRRIQKHVNWFFEHGVAKRIPFTPLAIDGDIGPSTKAAIKLVKKLLGYARPFQTWANGTYSQDFIERIHEPRLVGKRAVKRGLKARNAARAPVTPTTRAELAKAVLAHPRARFNYSSPTGGTARVGLNQTARGDRAHVASPEANDTGRLVWMHPRMLAFMLDCAEYSPGPVEFTCVVNGDHSSDSGHYLGEDVDVAKPVSRDAVNRAARENDIRVLDEDAYHFHVYVRW